MAGEYAGKLGSVDKGQRWVKVCAMKCMCDLLKDSGLEHLRLDRERRV